MALLYIYLQMKVNRQKPEKLSDKFKQLCQQNLRKQPPIHIISMIKQKTLQIDASSVKPQEVIFIEIALNLPLNRIIILGNQQKKIIDNKGEKPFYQTSKFKGLIKLISKMIEKSENLKSLTFEDFPFSISALSQLKYGLQLTKHLKELCFRGCNFTDEHFQAIKGSLLLNQSIISLDLSKNSLSDVGTMIGKVLSEHSQRRNEIIWMYSLRGQVPQEDISNNGLCEVNLQQNELNDRSATDLIAFLKDDSWTRCLNLRNNKINENGVRKFAYLLKKNKSLISLDLRGNPGLSKDLSRYIYKKLVANMENYKTQKKKIPNVMPASSRKKDVYKSLYQSPNKSQSKPMDFSIRNNATETFQKINNTLQNCSKCKKTTFDLLKLEKRNLDLQFELRKVKHILLTKNIDISAIFPQNNQISGSWSFNRQGGGGGEEEDLMARMQQVMMELTRIMQTIQNQQHTNINIDNPLSNPNSLSNTIPLFSRPQELEMSHEQQIN